jgi:hypothetical protein
MPSRDVLDDGAEGVLVRLGIGDEHLDLRQFRGDRLRNAAMPVLNVIAVAAVLLRRDDRGLHDAHCLDCGEQ